VGTLLIIDDDTTVRETLNDLLAGTHECHTAARAEQALEYWQLETYDVVFTDIAMPGLGGIEILKYITERHPMTPVIVVSGQIEAEKEAFMGMGAFDFFSKPFRLGEVEDAVMRAISYRDEMKAEASVGSEPNGPEIVT